MRDNIHVEIREPTQEDVGYLIANMRQADVDELMAMHGKVQSIVQLSFEKSRYKWSVYANGQFICLFGIGTQSLISDTGIIWMLGTDLIETYKGAFIRYSKAYIEAMLNVYPILTNHCDVRNTRTIRWLKFMGFKFDEPIVMGVQKLPFSRFELRK